MSLYYIIIIITIIIIIIIITPTIIIVYGEAAWDENNFQWHYTQNKT